MLDRLEALLDEYLDRVMRGEAVDIEQFISSHGEWSDDEKEKLRALAASITMPAPDISSHAEHDSIADSSARQGESSERGVMSAVFGHYRLQRVLGRGGQGVVYLAVDTRLSRRVALKVLDRPDLAVFAETSPTGPAARLKREAELASKLDHPGICVVYEMGVVHRSPFIAMRYVEGETLARKIAVARAAGTAALALGDPTPVQEPRREHRRDAAERVADGDELAEKARAATATIATTEDPMAAPVEGSPASDSSGGKSRRALTRSVRLVEKAARALHAAHRSGVIHRDVKPANIMVTPEGEPVLLDFGLARDESSDASSLTRTGEVFGSPGYMSPEQIEPRAGDVDERTDVYSLGIVLYECLTLRRPFEHPTRERLYRAVLEEPAPDPRRMNRAIDRELAVVLATAIEKSPDHRYKSALDFAEDLRRWREYEPILAKPASALLRVQRWVQRNRLLSASLVVFALLVAWIVNDQRTSLASEREYLETERKHGKEMSGSLLALSSSHELLHDPSLALLLSIESMDRFPGPSSRTALHAALASLHELTILQAHETQAAGLVLPREGDRVITAGKDGSVRVWDLATGCQIAELRAPAQEIDRLEISPDGSWIVAVSAPDRSVFAWSTESWRDRSDVFVDRADRSVVTPEHITHELRISPDGKRIAAWGTGGFAVWSLETSELRTFQGSDAGTANSAAWDPSGTRLLLLGPDLIWNPDTDETVALEVVSNSNGVSCAGGFTRDGSSVLIPLPDGVAVCSALSGELIRRLDTTTAARIAIPSPVGTEAFVGFQDDGGALFDVSTGWLRHDGLVQSERVASASYSANGESIAILCEDGLARSLDPQSGKEIARYLCTSPTYHFREFDGGARAATAHVDGTLRIWNRDDEWDRAVLEGGLPAHTEPGAAFDRQFERVALVAGDEVRVYDLSTRRILMSLRGHRGRVHTLVFTPDGKEILTASEDGETRRWNAATGDLIGFVGVRVPDHELWSVDVSADGKRILTASDEGVARIYDRTTSELVVELPNARSRQSGHWPGLYGASFSPDGARVVTVSRVGLRIQVWDVASSDAPIRSIEFQQRPQDHNRAPLTCSFTPDGRRILAGTADGHLVLLDATNAKTIRDVETKAPFLHAAISPNGQYVASGNRDRTVHLWRADDLQEVAVLPSHGSGVNYVAFSADSSMVLSIDNSYSVHLWPVEAEAWARERVPRGFTDEERERFNLKEPTAR
jgi:WD40 repeat protein